MRLDQFLRASRLVLRRTVAQELCGAGAVSVNGVKARSSREVHEGDEIAVLRRGRSLAVRVVSIPGVRQPSRGEAAALYAIVRDERTVEDEAAEAAQDV